jgi:hypothetical protein
MAGIAVGIAVKASSLKAAAATVVVPSIAQVMANGKAVTVGGAIVYKQTMVTIHNYAAEEAYAAFMTKWGAVQTPLTVAAVAFALILVGGYSIATWWNYYHSDYLEIPNTLIDVKETDLGDKYIKYSVAKVFNPEKGKENADFNGYEGKEWIALYYTKDANAGNCLTPNFVYRENNNTVAKRHQGISMFGEDKAFNLNSHVYNDFATGIYLSVRYSNTKKAAANMPTVVGSILGGAGYVLIGVAGAGLGAGFMAILQNMKKEEKKEENIEETPTTEE